MVLRKRQTLSSSLQISYLPFAAASWSGVNFHKSATLTEAPCLTSSSATSKWPYEQALWRGTRPLQRETVILLHNFIPRLSDGCRKQTWLKITPKSHPNTSVSPFVLGVHVRPMVQEILHHGHSVVAGSEVKRGRVPSLQISAIHILSRAQGLQRHAEEKED